MKCNDNTNHPASNKDDCLMTKSLNLLQGPGVNGLYQTAAPLSWEYDEHSETTTYVLSKDYTLHIRGCPAKEPGVPPLKPENYKLFDSLVCKLGDNPKSRQVELPLEEFLRLAGYAVTSTNKDAVRPRLKENVALLGALSADWREENGRYSHHDVKFFDMITYRHSRVYACFSERMALYLRDGCSAMPLPLSLLAISGKSPHSYSLGRRCLVYSAANKGREWQPIRVENLLTVCPRIPRPMPQEKWTPSFLERNVIIPFTTAMNSLAACGIFTWKFREPVCRGDYEGFTNSVVEFRLPDAVISDPPVEANTECKWSPDDTDWFLGLR